MKLSMAIRKGAKLHPQGRLYFGEYSKDNSEFFTCAIGAAYEAITKLRPPVSMLDAGVRNTVAHAVGININTRPLRDPVDGATRTVFDTIAQLNDRHKWTREAIADWLEGQGY